MSASFGDDDRATLFQNLNRAMPVALAVSGGGDSMALLALARGWFRAPVALTVDHGLREESAEEARGVAAWCAGHGIAHETLRWRSDGRGNLSDAARRGRYALMAEACAERGIGTLLTGHTLDDQAETVLMRLARGSGVDGLAGMRRETALHGLRIVRPLLGETRARLRDFLRGEGIDWTEDPTNEDRGYDRIRARDALVALEPLGIDAERLARTASMMASAREVLEERADALTARCCAVSPLGHATLDPTMLADAPRETALRLLSRLLCAVSGQAYRPRLERTEALLATVGRESFAGSTLHGCRIDPWRGGVAITREPAACAPRAQVTSSRAIWDERFRVEVDPADPALSIGAAGEEGLRRLKAEKPALPEAWLDSPRSARLCAPALWRGEEPVGIPLAGWRAAGETATLRAFTIRAEAVDPVTKAFI